jgi:hypothetical protein
MLIGAMGLSLGATQLLAQEMEDASTSRPPATSPRNSWLWRTTAEQGYDSNVRFANGTNDPDYVSRLNSSIAVLHSGPRGALGFLLDGSLIRYNSITELNSTNYDVGLTGRRRFTPRTTGTTAVFHRKLLATGVVGAAQLPLLALANQTSSGAAAGLEYRFTPRLVGALDADYTYVEFDTPALLSGGALQVRGRLRKQYTSRDAVVLEANVQQGRANGFPLAAQTLEAGWEPQLNGIRLRMLGGATRVSTGGPQSIVPTGLVEGRDSVGRGVFAAGVSRSVAQAFGIGQLLTTTAGNLSYDFQARRGNFLTLGASIADSRESTGSDLRFQTSQFTASLRRVLSNGATFGCGVAYREREDVTRASGLGAQMQLGYTFGSR